MPLLIGGESVKQARIRASDLLKRVGLGHRIEHKPGELSGVKGSVLPWRER